MADDIPREQIKKFLTAGSTDFLNNLRARPAKSPTARTVDELIDEILAARKNPIEAPGMNSVRTKLVTQIKHKPEPPSQEDLDFWDVMDEEYENVMKWFEDPKDIGSVDRGRPAGPDPSFWIDQFLAAPLAQDSAYFDPVPSDQLMSRYISAVNSLLPGGVGTPIFKTKLHASEKFQGLDLRHQQQALRWTEDLRDGKISEGMRARMLQAELIDRIIVNAGVKRGSGEYTQIASTFFQSSKKAREAYLVDWDTPLSGPIASNAPPRTFIDQPAWCAAVVSLLRRGAYRTA